MKVEAMMDDLFESSDFKRKESKYNKLLPLDSQRNVFEQFRWLPLSVFTPDRSTYWDSIIGDEGDEEKTRRSDKAKYLSSLRYSKFHPQLAEIVIRYWSQEHDLVVDPFAGRGTRGIVALKLNRRYQGYEVAPKTFAAVKPKVNRLGGTLQRKNGCYLFATRKNEVDLVFTCPPYHRLEKYENADGQLSDLKDYAEFVRSIHHCFISCERVLKPGKFLCWVCADWRDSSGLRLFHVDCLNKMRQAGFVVHDVVVIKNNSPFAALQAGKVAAKRITSKVHEYLLVARKPV